MSRLEVPSSTARHRILYVVILSLMTVLMIDLLLGNVADIYSEQIKSNTGIALFMTISLVSIARKKGRERCIEKDKKYSKIQ